MSKKKNAFPSNGYRDFDGMSFREYVATKVLQALIPRYSSHNYGIDDIADDAVVFANALIEALEKKEE